MSEQSHRISVVLSTRDQSSIRSWLARLSAALESEPTLDGATKDALVSRARPRWGVSSPDDAEAYIAFWGELVGRYPEPQLAGGYADVLFLLGGPDRRCEAIGVFLDAVRREPAVFIEYSGDFADFVPRCGPEMEREFAIATIAFYARRVDEGRFDIEDLQEAVRELLAKYDNAPELRARLFEIARRSFDSA